MPLSGVELECSELVCVPLTGTLVGGWVDKDARDSRLGKFPEDILMEGWRHDQMLLWDRASGTNEI